MGHGRDRDERGSVTAELALGLVSVTLIAGAGLWGLGVCGTQVRAQDMAAAIARQQARGSLIGETEVSRQVPQARVTTRETDTTVTVVVELPSQPWGALPPITTRGEATAVKEPGR